MTHSKKALGLVILLFLGVAMIILYIFSELYTDKPTKEINDNITFKNEYEKLNNDYINLTIDEDNPFIYKSEYELLDLINNKETFIVYFGYSKCNSCRSTLESFIKIAKNYNIKTVYYVDISNIRDDFELDENNNLVKTVDGTKGYYELLNAFDSILDNYEPLTYTNSKGKTKEVKVDEKRIYAPTYIIVKNGNPLKKENGISKLQKEDITELTDEIKKDQENIFNEFLKDFNENQNTCSANEAKC